MDKNAIKKYAVWARRELIERVSQRALRFGITADGNADPKADSVDGYLLSAVEKKQRAALIKKVEEHGYEQVLEEAAYTWFNRFAALRFMEVNGYLPSHVRVFTNEEGEFQPQILAEAIHLELDGLNMDKVYELKDANNTEELYRYLLIVQCNALSSILPGMFQRIADYTELLLPENLLREGSVLQQMIELIPEEDWQEQVQIIGWLYQYYNTEPKDKVFADLKKNIKVTKEKIPAATQLFTPDWIVRYMVENSLGRLWLEGHPNDTLKSTWKYYLDEAEQEEEVQKQLDEIRKGYASMKPEEIKVIDPCMGSGHILCYLFDVLVQIYEDYGHTAREAVEGILTNNLYGLDIDDRAAQLAYFAVMMKARQYDRRFFSRGIQPHVMAIQESNWYDSSYDYGMGDFLGSEEHRQTLNYLLETFKDAKEYGSILKLQKRDYNGLLKAWELTADATAPHIGMVLWVTAIKDEVTELIKQAIVMSQEYDVVVTNPPYMGSSNMSLGLSKFVKKSYPNSKGDLFAAFIEKCLYWTKGNGYTSMITMQSWMFLSSFEELRKKILKRQISSLIHVGYNSFPEINSKVALAVSFVVNNEKPIANGVYLDLTNKYPQAYDKEKAFFNEKKNGFYVVYQESYDKVPGCPVAYWASKAILNGFENGRPLTEISQPKQGLITGDNERFLRFWFEVSKEKISWVGKSDNNKWFPINKGGNYRKWYGNQEYVVNWENNGEEICNFRDSKGKLRSRPQNLSLNFEESFSWSLVTTGAFSVRYYPNSFMFNVAGISCFPKKDMMNKLLGLMNSKVVSLFTNILNPTINMNAGDVEKIPVLNIVDNVTIEELVKKCILESKCDWDAIETSWDYKKHPLVIDGKSLMSESYKIWVSICKERFETVMRNEEKINNIFIHLYGLENEITSDVMEKDVTITRIYDTKEKIPDILRGNNYVQTKYDVVISFISYAVGCMFGRYSLDVDCLAYAGGDWDASKYKTFIPDKDAIIPICDDEYFEDDIVGRFVQFVEVVYGKDTLEENLQFIADALGGRGTSREVIRNYFVSSFYADHVKTYKKRPIYWLFDSGKKNGFKCLIYMHRYQPDTLARIRTDYIHEQQSRYRTVIESLEQRIAAAGSASERVKLTKLLNTRQAQAKEIREYEEKVHHLADQMIKIDLDDGVKHNYAIFKDVLAKIK